MIRRTVVTTRCLVSLFALAPSASLFFACGTSSTNAQPQCPCTCPSNAATVAAAPSTANVGTGADPAAMASAVASAPTPGTSGNPNDYSPHEIAQEHVEKASLAMAKRDGARCLAELAEHDKLDPRHPSTDAKHAHVAMMRAECMMLAGQCTPGRDLLKSAYSNMAGMSPEHVERAVDAIVGMYCENPQTPRDRFLKARQDLTTGAYMTTKDAAFCKSAYQTIRSLRNAVKPKDDDDSLVKDPLPFMLSAAPACLVRAGDCDAAYAVYKEVAGEYYAKYPWSKDEKQLRTNFETMNAKCKK